jgi:hypothetical protein
MWVMAMQKLKLQEIWRKFAIGVVAIAFLFLVSACGGDKPAAKSKVPTGIYEVSPPAEIARLSKFFDRYEPQIEITSPQPDQTITDSKVSVSLAVKDLPIFKSSLGLGPHIHVILDNQEYKPLYNPNDTITFEGLTPGTHTLRAFASRPWHESFKNEGAYAQVTFHAFAKTGENTPSPQSPLLTYSRPVGIYGAEPVMLDFYLKNAPLHIAALEDEGVTDWQIRATVNGQSFLLENWQPIYLKGLKPGKNWVSLEFLDNEGNLILNQFNSTAHLIDYQPGGQDTLSKLLRDETITDIESIVDPDYVVAVPAPVSTPEAIAEPTPEAKNEVIPVPVSTPEAVQTSVPKAEVKETQMPEPVVVPAIKPEPIPEVKPEVKATSKPEVKPEAKPIPKATPTISPAKSEAKPEPTATPTPQPRRKLIKRQYIAPKTASPAPVPTAKPEVKPEVKPEPKATPTATPLSSQPGRKWRNRQSPPVQTKANSPASASPIPVSPAPEPTKAIESAEPVKLENPPEKTAEPSWLDKIRSSLPSGQPSKPEKPSSSQPVTLPDTLTAP